MKYSLRSLMIVVALVASAIGGRIEYLRMSAAFHLNETFRLVHAKHDSTRDALPDAVAAMQNAELARRFHAAISRPWTFVDTTPLSVSPWDAGFVADDMVAGDVAKHFIQSDEPSDEPLASEDGGYSKFAAESYRRYLRDHMPTSSARATNPPKN